MSLFGSIFLLIFEQFPEQSFGLGLHRVKLPLPQLLPTGSIRQPELLLLIPSSYPPTYLYLALLISEASFRIDLLKSARQ